MDWDSFEKALEVCIKIIKTVIVLLVLALLVVTYLMMIGVRV